MNILIFGISSHIGKSISDYYRNKGHIIYSITRDNFVNNLTLRINNIFDDYKKIEDYIKNNNIEMIIDSISVTSQKFDNQIFSVDDIRELTLSEIYSMIKLSLNPKLTYVYINTGIADLISPKKRIYTSTKKIKEIYLINTSRMRNKTIIINVLKPIKKYNERIGSFVFNSTFTKEKRCKKVFFGKQYFFQHILFFTVPIVYLLLINFKRSFWQSNSFKN